MRELASIAFFDYLSTSSRENRKIEVYNSYMLLLVDWKMNEDRRQQMMVFQLQGVTSAS